MSAELDKLLAKLKKDEKTEQKDIQKEQEQESEEENDEEEEENDTNDTNDTKDNKKDSKEEEKEQKVDPQQVVEQEVAIFQNNGIFRRELLIRMDQLTESNIAIAKALIQLLEKLK